MKLPQCSDEGQRRDRERGRPHERLGDRPPRRAAGPRPSSRAASSRSRGMPAVAPVEEQDRERRRAHQRGRDQRHVAVDEPEPAEDREARHPQRRAAARSAARSASPTARRRRAAAQLGHREPGPRRAQDRERHRHRDDEQRVDEPGRPAARARRPPRGCPARGGSGQRCPSRWAPCAEPAAARRRPAARAAAGTRASGERHHRLRGGRAAAAPRPSIPGRARAPRAAQPLPLRDAQTRSISP